MRGGVLLYAAQGITQIDAARAEKSTFRMETMSHDWRAADESEKTGIDLQICFKL